MVVDRIDVVTIAGNQCFIVRLALGDTLYEAGNDLVVLILPRVFVAPVVLEVALDNAHLFVGGLLGIFLHACVEGGIYFQSACIQVIPILIQPFFQVVGNGVAEIGGLTVIVFFYLEIKLDGKGRKRLVFFFADVTVLEHLLEHHVTAGKAVLGVGAWVVIGRSLEHTHQDGGLVGGELLGRTVKISLGSRLDTVRIGTEIYGIGVHGDDFLFRIDVFKL